MLKDPFEQLTSWWQEAFKLETHTPDAVHLSTVDELGHPNGRFVLLKYFDNSGLVFFTNYTSTKAQELEANPHAALTIYWAISQRQVRIRGQVSKTSHEESQAYFHTRPKGSQASAFVSPQSQIINSYAELKKSHDDILAKYQASDIPCPKTWGGYRLVPNYFEFWQGRQDRLHERFAYTKDTSNHWNISQLAP